MATDYAPVRQAIKSILANKDWDDGSIGPLLVRLAWHASGTYSKKTKTGGSNGATMRFKPESTDGANAGLEHARKFLEPIKQKFPWISYADLWTLGGVVAVQEMGGPKVPWKGGRTDIVEQVAAKVVPPNGFGYDGPWSYTPTRFSNQYFVLLKTIKWQKKEWDGPLQYVDPEGELMMLPTDLALIEDEEFKKWVDLYAKDKQVFFDDFASAFGKMLELGVVRQKI